MRGEGLSEPGAQGKGSESVVVLVVAGGRGIQAPGGCRGWETPTSKGLLCHSRDAALGPEGYTEAVRGLASGDDLGG